VQDLIETLRFAEAAHTMAKARADAAMRRFTQLNLSLSSLRTEEIASSVREWQRAREEERKSEGEWLSARNRVAAAIRQSRLQLMK